MQLALEMMLCLAGVVFLSFTPSTMVMSSFLAGALMMTFLAPASRWPLAFAASVNNPVLSTTMSTPSAFHGNAAGPSLTARHLISWPSTTSTSSSAASALGLLARDGARETCLGLSRTSRGTRGYRPERCR